jgi:Glycosyl hydrolase family 3 C-terminal domain
MALTKADRSAIDNLCNPHWPCIVVVLAGRPIALSHAFQHPYVDAVVHAWLPGSEGGKAIVNKLLPHKGGTWNYEGRLPVAWPVDMDKTGKDAAKLFEYAYGCSTVKGSKSGGIVCDASALAKKNRGSE